MCHIATNAVRIAIIQMWAFGVGIRYSSTRHTVHVADMAW